MDDNLLCCKDTPRVYWLFCPFIFLQESVRFHMYLEGLTKLQLGLFVRKYIMPGCTR